MIKSWNTNNLQKKMNKSELISALYEQLPFKKKDVKSMVNTTLRLLDDVLHKGQAIEIRDFGHFTRGLHKARRARNPKNGEKVMTPARYFIRFKAGKGLRERVNQAAGKPQKTDKE